MSLIVLAVVATATLVTSFISGILGMAGGMILMGVLLATLPVATAMLLHGITQFSANGYRAWMLRGSVDWRVFRGYAIGSVAPRSSSSPACSWWPASRWRSSCWERCPSSRCCFPRAGT